MLDDILNWLTLMFDKPPEEVVEFLESKGVAVTWGWREQLDAVKSHTFTIAKVANADILQLFQDELEKALALGTPFKEFKDEMEPMLEKRGYAKRDDGSAFRLETIYRTNLQSAFMGGRFKQMKSVAKQFPYWQFLAISDDRTTDDCKELDGVVAPADDKFWNGNYPPRHYNCRSRVRALSEKLLKRYNLKPSDPDRYRDVQPAEGFDSNPGEWKPDFSKYDKKIKNELKQELE